MIAGMKTLLVRAAAGAVLLVVGLFNQAAAETVTYIHTDALGSPVAETDAAGNVIRRTVYEPYGAVVGQPVADGPGYTGHVSDASTGLSYMQQRYMDPGLGVFLSVDPVTAYEAPVMQFNRYRYGNGSPYRFVDPDGRCAMRTGSRVCGGGGASPISVMYVNASSTGGRASVIAHNGRSKDIPINSATVNERYQSAVRALDRIKDGVESISHRSKRDAAMTFDAMIQPIIEKYGVEVDGIPTNPAIGGRLQGLYVGNRFEGSTGIGYSVNAPTGGESSIHGHPLVRDHGGSHSPFSPGDVNWYRTTPGVPHFLTTPNGVFEFSNESSPVLQIGK